MKFTMFLIVNVLVTTEVLFSFSTGFGAGLSLKNIGIYPIAFFLLIDASRKKSISGNRIPGIRSVLYLFLFLFVNMLASNTSVELSDQLSVFKSFILDNWMLFLIPFLVIDDQKTGANCLKIVVIIFLILNLLSLMALKLDYDLFLIQQNVESYSRFSGPFENPNQMAYFFCFLLPFVYYLYKSAQKKILKKIYFVGMIGAICSIILSGSRGGILSLLIVMTLIFYFSKDYKILFLGVGLSLVLIVLAIVYSNELLQQTYERLAEITDKNVDIASAGRTIIWRKLYYIFVSNPFNIIMGTGFGTYRNQLVEMFGMKSGSHNIYLQLLVELGLMGFSIFLLVLSNIYRFIKNLNIDEFLLFKNLTLTSLFVVLFGWMFSDLSGILRFVSIVSGTAIAFLYHSQSEEKDDLNVTERP